METKLSLYKRSRILFVGEVEDYYNAKNEIRRREGDIATRRLTQDGGRIFID